MAYNNSNMKLKFGEKLVISKFAEFKRQREFEFIGVIDTEKGKSYISTVVCRFKIEAMNHFKAVAKEKNGKVNIKTVRVLN